MPWASTSAYSINNDANFAGSSRDTEYIVLERPNTLLLMASVAGGYAKRGAFTGAMARQFAKADGKTTIEGMVTNAIRDMKEKETQDFNQNLNEETPC